MTVNVRLALSFPLAVRRSFSFICCPDLRIYDTVIKTFELYVGKKDMLEKKDSTSTKWGPGRDCKIRTFTFGCCVCRNYFSYIISFKNILCYSNKVNRMKKQNTKWKSMHNLCMFTKTITYTEKQQKLQRNLRNWRNQGEIKEIREIKYVLDKT